MFPKAGQHLERPLFDGFKRHVGQWFDGERPYQVAKSEHSVKPSAKKWFAVKLAEGSKQKVKPPAMPLSVKGLSQEPYRPWH